MDESQVQKFVNAFQEAIIDQNAGINKARKILDNYDYNAQNTISDENSKTNGGVLARLTKSLKGQETKNLKLAFKANQAKQDMRKALHKFLDFPQALDLMKAFIKDLQTESERGYEYDHSSTKADLADMDGDSDKTLDVKTETLGIEILCIYDKVYLDRVTIENVLGGKSLKDANNEAKKALASQKAYKD